MEKTYPRPTMRLRPTEGRSFYPKIKHKFNLNTSPEFSDYNPNSSTGAATSLLIPQSGPIVYVRNPVSLYHDASSFASGTFDPSTHSQDDSTEYGIRYEKTLHVHSSDSDNSDALGPLLISSFPIPRVNGMTVTNKIVPVRLGFRNSSSQTDEYDITKMSLPGIREHRIWREEMGGPFIEMLQREVLKNRPVDLEDFVISLCEARLQGKPIPQTAVGHNGAGDGVKAPKKNIIRIMRKESNIQECMGRKGSLDLMGNSFSLGLLKRGSFMRTPLVDLNSIKRNSFSSSDKLSFSKPSSSSNESSSRRDNYPTTPLGSSGDFFSSSRRQSAESVASSEDSNDGNS